MAPVRQGLRDVTNAVPVNHDSKNSQVGKLNPQFPSKPEGQNPRQKQQAGFNPSCPSQRPSATGNPQPDNAPPCPSQRQPATGNNGNAVVQPAIGSNKLPQGNGLIPQVINGPQGINAQEEATRKRQREDSNFASLANVSSLSKHAISTNMQRGVASQASLPSNAGMPSQASVSSNAGVPSNTSSVRRVHSASVYTRSGYTESTVNDVQRNRISQDVHRVAQDAHRIPQDAHRIPQDTNRITQDVHRIPPDAHRIPQDAHRIPQDAHRKPQDAHQIPQDAHRIPQDAPLISQDARRVSQHGHEVSHDEQVSEDEESEDEEAGPPRQYRARYGSEGDLSERNDLFSRWETQWGTMNISVTSSTHQKLPQLALDYSNPIYNHLRRAENKVSLRADPNYLEDQGEIRARMREILLDWLVEVHYKFKLQPETLYLCINLIDRAFSKDRNVPRKKMQLVGGTCMLIASKYEEFRPPEVGDICYIMDNAYTKEEILDMEVRVLNLLQFKLTVPSPLQFLEFFIRELGITRDDSHFYLAQYLIEATLLEVKFLKYKPSEIAAACLYLANRIRKKSVPWPPALHWLTGYDELLFVKPLAKEIFEIMKRVKDKALYQKYSMSKYHKVAPDVPNQ